jgi:hypothetical protein
MIVYVGEIRDTPMLSQVLWIHATRANIPVGGKFAQHQIAQTQTEGNHDIERKMGVSLLDHITQKRLNISSGIKVL